MKRIKLEEICQRHKSWTYNQIYEYILRQISENKLKPLKASKKNGKKPALYNEYWVVEEKPDYSALLEELRYQIHPRIHTDYYSRNPKIYAEDREWVLKLNAFLMNDADRLNTKVSVNERSFMIWRREKFLSREQGARILKRCGILPGELNYYETAEPFSYYARSRATPQNLLILENKDTFYSMRKCLLENRTNGGILGMEIGTLIYGEGKGILRSFQDFSFSAEPFMNAEDNVFYYFGDLDYEGIGIYENLAESVRNERRILPFKEAYLAMIDKAGEDITSLPETKEKQNREIKELFFSFFSSREIERIRRILEIDRYIPQEILNIQDYEGE